VEEIPKQNKCLDLEAQQWHTCTRKVISPKSNGRRSGVKEQVGDLI